ncbi:MAG TPA: hypothetical protein VHG53_04030 [Candidatus Limnocylindria bacterium]|nr:hypothetical protein [Candidatus Limnocylindria bacterium]
MPRATPPRVERLVLLDPALHIPPGPARTAADAVRSDTSWALTEEAIAVRIATGIAPYAPREFWDNWAPRARRRRGWPGPLAR